MTVTPKQIEFLARAIVNRLEDRGLVEFTDAEAGIDLAIRILADNFKAIEMITNDARTRATKAAGREPTEEELEAEVRRVATERGVIL